MTVLCGEADEGVLWLASLWGSGCVLTVLCCEADEGVLWLASLWGSGCVLTVLCCEADEGVLWLASLWGRSIYCGGWISLWMLCVVVCGLWFVGFVACG